MLLHCTFVMMTLSQHTNKSRRDEKRQLLTVRKKLVLGVNSRPPVSLLEL